MVALAQQIRPLQSTRRVLAAAGLLTSIVWWGLGLQNALHEERALAEHITSAQNDLQVRATKSVQAAQAVDEAGRLGDLLAAGAPKIVTDGLTAELTALARQTGVRRVAVQVALPAEEGGLKRYPVVVDFEADSAAALAFVRQADTGPHPARLRTVRFHATDATATQFEVQASLDYFGVGLP